MSRIAPLYIGGRALRANGQRPEIDMARAGVRGPTDQPKKCKLKGVKVLRLELVWLESGLAFERSHTILGLRGGVHTPSGGVNTAGVHTRKVMFTQYFAACPSIDGFGVWIVLSEFERF